MLFSAQVLAAVGLDLLLGDPRWFPHPVRLMGWSCRRVERLTRKWERFIGLRWCGVITFWTVLALSAGTSWLLLCALEAVHPAAAVAGAVLLLYLCVAIGDLLRHSSNVLQALAGGDLELARERVALIVGRDTAEMDGPEISRAAIESVAENFVDGITAPLFWACAAGVLAPYFSAPPITAAALGALCYKAINTMDSMIAYKNETYLDFGRFAARADDAANFLPARISGLCIVMAAMLPGFSGRHSAVVFFADRLKSSSPNSGHTEAAAAGALGLQLGGPSRYFGTIVAKPLIGAGLAEPGTGDIGRCNRLVGAATAVFLGAALCFSHLFLTVAL